MGDSPMKGNNFAKNCSEKHFLVEDIKMVKQTQRSIFNSYDKLNKKLFSPSFSHIRKQTEQTTNKRELPSQIEGSSPHQVYTPPYQFRTSFDYKFMSAFQLHDFRSTTVANVGKNYSRNNTKNVQVMRRIIQQLKEKKKVSSPDIEISSANKIIKKYRPIFIPDSPEKANKKSHIFSQQWSIFPKSEDAMLINTVHMNRDPQTVCTGQRKGSFVYPTKDLTPSKREQGTVSSEKELRVDRKEYSKKQVSNTPLKNCGKYGMLHMPDQEIKTEEPMKQSAVQPPKVNGWSLGRTLGKGRFGEVRMCVHDKTMWVAAVKIIHRNTLKQPRIRKQLQEEIRLQCSLYHPNIVSFYTFFCHEDSIYIVMEYLSAGTLFQRLNEVGRFPLGQACEIITQVVSALKHLHGKSIAHRDIKPQNIVLGMASVAKLCDFGWAAHVRSPRLTYCGTLEYSSPQMLEHKEYDLSVDIWCIGMLLYELLVGGTPYEGMSRDALCHSIVNLDFALLETNIAKILVQSPNNKMSPEARAEALKTQNYVLDFVRNCLKKNPEERPKASQLSRFQLFQQHNQRLKYPSFAQKT